MVVFWGFMAWILSFCSPRGNKNDMNKPDDVLDNAHRCCVSLQYGGSRTAGNHM
jgi:hypothetical protein